ncbi:MAG: hypothetical protein VXX85_05315 [Candidatus Margulisiibacteriota bacterium]|nr:hypothetical protein [Candidatus Margulisiibacteriota bacterium]
MNKKLNVMILEEYCLNKNDMESIFPHAFNIVRSSEDMFEEVKLETSTVDMIILDEDTQEVIQILNKLKKSTSIPIFLMASKPAIKNQAKSFNVDGIIHEPFDISSFNKIFNHKSILKRI